MSKVLEEMTISPKHEHNHEHGENCACENHDHHHDHHGHDHGHSGCGCGCGHDHDHHHDAKEGNELKIFLVRLLISISILVIINFTTYFDNFAMFAYIIAYLLAGAEVLYDAGRNILKGQMFDENFLMGIASLGAFVIGERSEAVAVMVFYGIGELLQNIAVARSRKDIAQLMDIRPDSANLKKENGDIVTVKPEEIKIGDIIVVRAGEKVPLDGEVFQGESFLDTAALTGESVPRHIRKGDPVLSGAINENALIEVKVTKLFSDSTASKILELVQNASSKKAKSEKFITKFARYYTPVVVLATIPIAILPPLLGFGDFDTWLYRSLSFLIISCPCALVMSIPISFFGGIGGASRHGVLVKGGNYLEALNTIDTLVMDKTGTLTEGVFKVKEIKPFENKVSEEELLEITALIEAQSTHPIAKSILNAYGKTPEYADEYKEVSGQGIITKKGDTVYYAGNAKLIEQLEIVDLPKFNQTVIYVARNTEYLGYILISDELRKDVKESLKAIKETGIKKIIMLTGDTEAIAKEVAENIGIDEVHAELLPQDKVSKIEKIMEQAQQENTTNKGRVAFVGDGINDAPVLSRADIGFAMGGIGSDAAIEAADIVIMNDSVGKIATAFKVAQKTRSIVMQNIVFCLGVKAIIMIFAFMGLTSIWFAIFADVGVALLAVLNSTRSMFVK